MIYRAPATKSISWDYRYFRFFHKISFALTVRVYFKFWPATCKLHPPRIDIISYVALFYVVHVIHWLLKYVSSNDKYSKVWRILFVWYSFQKNAWYMKLCSRTKCWQVTLRFNCLNNFHFFFFKKESAIFRFVIQSDHAIFILKYPDRVYFFCNIFSYPVTLANSLFSLSRPPFFSIFLILRPSRKIMVRPLTTAETGWRNGLKPSSLIHFNDIEQLLLLIILFLFLSFWRHRGFQRLSCIQFFY